MKNLDKKIILYLGRTPNFGTEVKLQDNYTGGVSKPFIKEWNITSEKAKPTDSQLNALESQATTLANNEVIRQTRKKSYGNIGDQLDLLYKDMLDDKGDKTGEWFKKIKAVKDANAKE
tara:strand:+ start:301 stop:654 length:354 start_codon:yes stop_codon:yes gene_type:complete